MLTTIDLKRMLRGVKHFGGVFPSDKLPLVLKKPSTFIINLDPSYKEGSHWVAVNFDKIGNSHYFDSYGRPPDGNIVSFLERFSPRGYTYSINKYQDDYSSSCGYFCVLFVLLADDQNKFYKIFEKCKTLKNEQKLLQIIKNFID